MGMWGKQKKWKKKTQESNEMEINVVKKDEVISVSCDNENKTLHLCWNWIREKEQRWHYTHKLIIGRKRMHLSKSWNIVYESKYHLNTQYYTKKFENVLIKWTNFLKFIFTKTDSRQSESLKRFTIYNGKASHYIFMLKYIL